MFTAFKNKLLCWLGRHDWVEHDRGFHRICSRCGKTRWIVEQ
jgi:hypothetical protein